MIITLKGADFSQANINDHLKNWFISTVMGEGATYNGPSMVEKGAALNATVTLGADYAVGADGIVVTMGGVDYGATTIDGNTINVNIESVTGSVVIKVSTINRYDDGRGEAIPANSIEEMNEVVANATAYDVGKIYQYTGETTDEFENGAFYQIFPADEE